MATQDIKDFLFEKTGVSQNNWKRTAKKSTPNGSIRVFENKLDNSEVWTLETKSGELSIVDKIEIAKNPSSDMVKKAKVLVKNFYEKGTVLTMKQSGFEYIPRLFNFSFSDDSNIDHDLTIPTATGKVNTPVTGFNVFFSVKDEEFEDYACEHISPLIINFIPNFMQETEESVFTIHSEHSFIYGDERLEKIANGSIPNISYNQLIESLEKMGFRYNHENCMLASLSKSNLSKTMKL